jgi:hypothetical protein
MTLIAEDVLLLLLDDAKGTVSTWGNTDLVLRFATPSECAGTPSPPGTTGTTGTTVGAVPELLGHCNTPEVQGLPQK